MDGAKRAPAAERDTCDAADRRSAIVVTVAVKGAGRFVPGQQIMHGLHITSKKIDEKGWIIIK